MRNRLGSGIRNMNRLRCPVCDTLVDPEISLSLPFCSRRCRQLDLNRWLSEDYSIERVRDSEEEEVDAMEEHPNQDEE